MRLNMASPRGEGDRGSRTRGAYSRPDGPGPSRFLTDGGSPFVLAQGACRAWPEFHKVDWHYGRTYNRPVPKKVNMSQKLDEKDRRILALVQRDGKQSQAEIARHVGLSAPAVNERLRRLERSGVIRRFAALVDPRAVGASITAFVEVFIEHPRFEPAFIEQLLKLDEVQ